LNATEWAASHVISAASEAGAGLFSQNSANYLFQVRKHVTRFLMKIRDEKTFHEEFGGFEQSLESFARFAESEVDWLSSVEFNSLFPIAFHSRRRSQVSHGQDQMSLARDVTSPFTFRWIQI
jgi:hypothetical protein